MTTELTQEDRAILEVLGRLNRDETASPEEAELTREYTELAGLLPYELEPVAPRAETWESIRARAGAGRQSAAAPLIQFPKRSESAPEPRPVTPLPAPAPAYRGLYAMAAALALCLLGLGFFWSTVRQQQWTIDRLASDLDAATVRQTEELRFARDQIDMITRVARQYYPMRPAAARPEPLDGKVFVCGQHQQWYLNVQGLEPPPPGHEYCLWFVTDEGMVMGGAVELRQGAAELSARSMPEGTNGFAVTLEEKGSRHDEPHGDILLFGEEAVSM